MDIDFDHVKDHTNVCTFLINRDLYLPGASDSSRVCKGSGTASSEAPDSRIVAGLSTGKQKQCNSGKAFVHLKEK